MFLKTRDPLGLLKLYKEPLMKPNQRCFYLLFCTQTNRCVQCVQSWPHSNLNKNISLSLSVFVELLHTTLCCISWNFFKFYSICYFFTFYWWSNAFSFLPHVKHSESTACVQINLSAFTLNCSIAVYIFINVLNFTHPGCRWLWETVALGPCERLPGSWLDPEGVQLPREELC